MMRANKFTTRKRQNGLVIIAVCLLLRVTSATAGMGSLRVTGSIVGGVCKVKLIGRGGGNSGPVCSSSAGRTLGSLLADKLPSSSAEDALQELVGGSDCIPNYVTEGGPLGGILGSVAVLGGILVHLTLGTMYCWGNFAPYVPPNLRCVFAYACCDYF